MTSPVMTIRQCLNVRRIPLLAYNRKMSTEVCTEVLFEEKGKGGFALLNRPKALNALNANMAELISDKLTEWEKNKDFIIMRGVGRAFCAGGDIVCVTRGGPKDTCDGEHFFKTEYAMNYKISKLSIPYVALIDGITMGGGVGLSVHGKYRVATENTLFAMPETQIGLFPDVGGSYFLSRMGPLGIYLALTGYRLQGTDVAKAGFATHFMPSSEIPQLLQELETKTNSDNLENILASHSKCLKSQDFSLGTKMSKINSVFSSPTVEEMLDKLNADGSEWSLATMKALNKMSPISLKITVRELVEGRNKTLKECLEMEYRLALAALKAKISNDFYEGVRSLLVDKDKKPVWNPSTVEAINDEVLDKVFENLPCAKDELVLC